MFINSKIICFQLWFVYKSGLWISILQKTKELSELNSLNLKYDNILHIIDQIKVSRIPL